MEYSYENSLNLIGNANANMELIEIFKSEYLVANAKKLSETFEEFNINNNKYSLNLLYLSDFEYEGKTYKASTQENITFDTFAKLVAYLEAADFRQSKTKGKK